MNPVWPALAIGLPLTYGVLHAFAAPLYLQVRGDRNEWKKPPIPQQRGPRGMTYGARQLYLADRVVSIPNETEESAA